MAWPDSCRLVPQFLGVLLFIFWEPYFPAPRKDGWCWGAGWQSPWWCRLTPQPGQQWWRAAHFKEPPHHTLRRNYCDWLARMCRQYRPNEQLWSREKLSCPFLVFSPMPFSPPLKGETSCLEPAKEVLPTQTAPHSPILNLILLKYMYSVLY